MQLDTTLGVTRLGHYRLIRRLAVGGMAELFVAVAEGAGAFEKPVAIKRILPRLAREPEFVKMFFAEAELAASLDHPHIAKVLDFGEEGELPYIVMELVHGVDLSDLLRSSKGPLPDAQAATIAVQVAEALQHVHDHCDLHTGAPLGLVHRDVTPSNVLVGYSGGAKLTDFGIVKATSATQYTATGALKGKLSYLAPEQARCERLDRRTDVYALGLVMYELFTGRRMHRAMSEVALLARVCDGEYTPPSAVRPDIDTAVESIIARALLPDPRDRYTCTRDVSAALETLASQRGWVLSMAKLSEYLETQIPNPGPVTIEPSTRPESSAPAPVSKTASLGRAVKSRGRSIAMLSVLLGVGIGAGLGPTLLGNDQVENPTESSTPCLLYTSDAAD
ncbi:MAG: serine/threonine protein kinase, partial [Nannocystaceae bacterium]|nr:serine/threonine protein kinase [Nannocystaceae bacterium]